MTTISANALRILICMAWSACLTNEAFGQFTTVLNIPPQPNLGQNQSIGSGVQLNLFDAGAIGGFFDAGAPDGTSLNVEVNIRGGIVDDVFRAHGAGATVNVSGGSVGRVVQAFGGAVVNISGGTVGDFLHAVDGSEVNISGGAVGNEFDLGREFDPDSGAAANISGGTIGIRSNSFGGSVVTISGGSIGREFVARERSLVKITGGTVGDDFAAVGASVVELSGGSIGDHASASGSTILMSGGSVGNDFRVHSGSVFNLAGGAVGNYFLAGAGSSINLFGTQFVLDGVDITASLAPDVPHTIEVRDVVLAGMLADGSPFDFELNSTRPRVGPAESFDLNATITVTRLTVPEPQSLAMVMISAILLSAETWANSRCRLFAAPRCSGRRS